MLSHAVAPDRLGGLERYVRELSAALVRAGADVTVLAKRLDPEHPPDERGDDGVRILRHDAPNPGSPTYAATVPFAPWGPVLRRAARPGVVLHGHYVLPTVPLVAARRSFVYTFHAPMWRELLSEREGRFALPRPVQVPAERAVRRLERAVVRRATTVVTLSDFMRREVEGLDADAGSRVVLLPGGIDTTRFSPGPGHVPQAGAPRIFTARRLTPRTGISELVHAMVRVRRAIPGATLAVAGDGVLRDELQGQIDRHGLDGAVELLGRISEDELVRRYRSADLVVMPTQRLEGFGLTTAEALACGTVVVGTPVGATPEILDGLAPELVTGDRDPGSIADAVARVLGAPERLAELRGRARAHVSPAYDWSTIAARYLEIYAAAQATHEARGR